MLLWGSIGGFVLVFVLVVFVVDVFVVDVVGYMFDRLALSG